MRNVESIQELFTLSQERLSTILGNAGSAKELWEFIHNDNKPLAKVQTTTQRNRR
jgi:ERCC4-type nuclease